MYEAPFCPHRSCACHTKVPATTWYSPFGTYTTKAFGKVQRFRCHRCGKTFSEQTFSVHYYAKRVIPLDAIEDLDSSSMSIRHIARYFHCSCCTIINRIDRLARQGIMVHGILRRKASTNEAVCLGSIDSFDRSRYLPNDVGFSITASARFILGLSHLTRARSGSLTDGQKKRCERLYAVLRFEPRGIERSVSEHLDLLEREREITKRRPLLIVTDEKGAYDQAIRSHRLYLKQDEEHRVVHERISSAFPRTTSNPLFPAHYIDREVRKDQAQHRRETPCFCRNAANGMSRLYSYAVWHNYGKKYLIKWPVRRIETHAEMAGIDGDDVKELRKLMFQRRAFLSHLELGAIDRKVWTKTVYSPEKGMFVSGTLPKFAFA